MSKRTNVELDVEHKFVDSSMSGTAWETTWGYISPVNFLVAQGDGESERDGRVYWITSLEGRMRICVALAEQKVVPKAVFMGRYILFIDHQTNGALAATADVINEVASGHMYSYPNLTNEERFTILEDQIVHLPVQIVNEGSINSFATQASLTHVHIKHVFDPPLKVTCGGTTADISDVMDNSIHFMAVKDTFAAINTQSGVWRLRFYG